MDAQPRIGINLPDDPDPEAIQGNLKLFADSGFETVELSLDMAPMIVGGDIRGEYVSLMARLLKGFPLGLSAHIGSGLDLRDREAFDLHEKVLESSIRVCESLGASPLVLHYEQETRDLLIERRFADAHARAARLAGECGVQLCLENIEVDTVEPVVRLVREIGSPWLRMTFDTGHAFLAAAWFHFDFLASLRTALPVLGHVHLSDNTGRFEPLRLTDRPAYDAMGKGMRFAFGRGDVHLPPYWGAIPFDRVFEETRGFPGVYVCEFYSRFFRPFLGDIREHVRAAIARARGGAG
jgi:sugar phosphate isomerase/epimerase